MTNPRDDLMALAPCPFCGGEAERIACALEAIAMNARSGLPK